jgi:hypothetical protein
MVMHLKALAAGASAIAVLGGAGSALAQACCNVPSSHEVRVPGVVVGRPRVQTGCGSSCAPPPCQQGCNNGGGGQFSGSFSFNAEVSANAAAISRAQALAAARANSAAFGLGGAINGSMGFGGGGSSFWLGYNQDYIPNLVVEEGAAMQAVTVPYQATRSWFKMVTIQAVCMDSKLVPHPASQVKPGKDVAETYDGELFRCLAGTRLQYTWSEGVDKAAAQTVTCAANQALYHSPGGKVECRAQRAARDCNERSLLRRYGAGVKVLKMAYTETYTAYRTEWRQVQGEAAAVAMSLDGGVGGIAY